MDPDLESRTGAVALVAADQRRAARAVRPARGSDHTGSIRGHRLATLGNLCFDPAADLVLNFSSRLPRKQSAWLADRTVAASAPGESPVREQRSQRARWRSSAHGHFPTRTRHQLAQHVVAQRDRPSSARFKSFRKWLASTGMSSLRSRRGGTWIGKTLSRKNRSSRNSPAAISSLKRTVGRGQETNVKSAAGERLRPGSPRDARWHAAT